MASWGLAAIEGVLLLGSALLFARAARRASAAFRYQLVLAALVATAGLPLLARVAPTIELAWLDPPSGRLGRSWSAAALVVWLAGAAVVAAHFVRAHVGLRLLRRRARVVDHPIWRAVVDELRDELRLERPVTLLTHRGVRSPAAWGVRRAAVLLPEDANLWPAERRRGVLLHELGHLRRRDPLTQIASEVACAIAWFNPLVWIARKRLQAERENACDDLVVGARTRPSRYAGVLLDMYVALRVAPSRLLAAAPFAWARRLGDGSPLETRISRLLSPGRRRGEGAPLATTAAVLGIALPLAGLELVERPPEVVAAVDRSYVFGTPVELESAELESSELESPEGPEAEEAAPVETTAAESPVTAREGAALVLAGLAQTPRRDTRRPSPIGVQIHVLTFTGNGFQKVSAPSSGPPPPERGTARLFPRRRGSGPEGPGGYVMATYSFLHGTRDDVSRTRNDWDLQLTGQGGELRFHVNTVTDDRSGIATLGELELDGVSATDHGSEVDYDRRHRAPVTPGHAYLVHTRDTDSELWTAFRVTGVEPDGAVTLEWSRLEPPEPVDGG